MREITLDIRDNCLDLLNENNLPLVEELTFERWEHIAEEYIKAICNLTKLTKLTLKCISERNMETRRVTESDIMNLVKALPKLVNIDLNLNFKFSLKFGLELQTYLHQEGRFVCIK